MGRIAPKTIKSTYSFFSLKFIFLLLLYLIQTVYNEERMQDNIEKIQQF